jgi:hypothetical protein
MSFSLFVSRFALEEELRKARENLKESKEKAGVIRRETQERTEEKQGKLEMAYKEKQGLHSLENEILRLESLDHICLVEERLRRIINDEREVDISIIYPELQQYSMLEGNNKEFIDHVLRWQELVLKEKEALAYFNKDNTDCKTTMIRINALRKDKEEAAQRLKTLNEQILNLENEIRNLEVVLLAGSNKEGFRKARKSLRRDCACWSSESSNWRPIWEKLTPE